ncbi:MAG: NAD(P)-dependent glycerol-3-phosphate dehydrogenase [Oscillospiraceae bacterium]|nr:NAD(P)-dependent glycerol-3-phosphate dehydrogenase [Oscillospiraceae bacterium]
MANISIMGAGSFGLALAVTVEKNGHDVTVWSFQEKEKLAILEERENKERLPGVKIPKNINITSDLSEIRDSEFVVTSVPSSAVRNVVRNLKKHIKPDAVVVNVSKGFEKESLKSLSQVIAEELTNEIVVVCGPSHAEELARAVPTSVVAASANRKTAEKVAALLQNEALKVFVSDDVKGLEVGGTFKNVVAIATGLCAKLGGDNLLAILLARGLCEIGKLGVAMGAKPQTFAGLSGLGDLIATCISEHSRNVKFGKLIGCKVPVDEALKQVNMVVEGYENTYLAKRLMEEYNLDLPVMNCVYGILYESKKIDSILETLQSSRASEDCWF